MLTRQEMTLGLTRVTKMKVDVTLRVTRPENARVFLPGFITQRVMATFVARVCFSLLFEESHW